MKRPPSLATGRSGVASAGACRSPSRGPTGNSHGGVDEELGARILFRMPRPPRLAGVGDQHETPPRATTSRRAAAQPVGRPVGSSTSRSRSRSRPALRALDPYGGRGVLIDVNVERAEQAPVRRPTRTEGSRPVGDGSIPRGWRRADRTRGVRSSLPRSSKLCQLGSRSRGCSFRITSQFTLNHSSKRAKRSPPAHPVSSMSSRSLTSSLPARPPTSRRD